MTTQVQNDVALYSKDGKNWVYADGSSEPIHWDRNELVTKIVIGEPNENVSCELPSDFSNKYPRLTHLHLWGIVNVKNLGGLPSKMQCLDIRNCALLEELEGVKSLKSHKKLPSRLETLVLQGCPKLCISTLMLQNNQHKPIEFSGLNDLDISSSINIPQEIIWQLLDKSPNVKSFKASRCTQLKMLKSWPEKLYSIALNGCTELCTLPPQWPSQLRKLELSGAVKISALPNFVDSLDYIDLSRTYSLKKLPNERGKARTLFLYDSGLLAPPASEHGTKAQENVAEKTAEFFNDLDDVGPGFVKRCKVQMLGNGSAGKTSLSLLFTGQNPHIAGELGSTHGVRFDTTEIDIDHNGIAKKVDLQVWDFGGQEIYHGTHRLFMSKGSLFVVLWNPGQDGGQPPRSSESGYQDTWRPLQYWIELIHLSCRAPRIAVVCSHQSARSEALLTQYNHAVNAKSSELPPLFFINSWENKGEIEEFNAWLEETAADIIVSQGERVPSYWEVAQDMVLKWLGVLKASSDNESPEEDDEEIAQQITFDEFRIKLNNEIATSIAAKENPYPKLREAFNAGHFTMTDNRIQRTLSFLTHSGWLFWSESLFEKRVIVGQEWALNGLYMVLNRRDNERVYNELKRDHGMFTRSKLAELKWRSEGIAEGDQELLLSYMNKCGLCFTLRDKENALKGESVYLSIEHLNTTQELGLVESYNSEAQLLNNKEEQEEQNRRPVYLSEQMHGFHWRQFLIKMGRTFGTAASYASDGVLLRTDKDQLALVRCQFDCSGIGAKLAIDVSGAESEDLYKTLIRQFESILPFKDADIVQMGKANELDPSTDEEVFISYAWNDSKPKPNAPDYEEPVERIKDYIQRCNAKVGKGGRKVRLLIDKDEMKRFDSIQSFMDAGTKASRVIVIHSQRYFKSPNCIYEMDLLMKRGDDFIKNNVIPVDIDSSIDRKNKYDEYCDFWEGIETDKIPSRLQWNARKARTVGCNVVMHCGENFSDSLNLNLKWSAEDDQTLRDIASRLDLPAADD